MPKISDERREERRSQIIAAALRRLSNTGYQGTSMADIIAESGLSAGAIYGYFSSKQELILAVATSVVSGRQDEVLAASVDHVLEPAEIVTVLIDGLRENAPVHMLLQVWGEASVDPQLRTLLNEVLESARATITEQLARWALTQPSLAEDASGWAGRAAPVLLALIPGFVTQLSLVDGFDEKRFLQTLPTVLRGSF
ncbi:TetR/AcrR family transcriptional regulator [Paramicrobacterium fandaimingii]|uniref:TetR/AcrR family transcriptional regulator n=1 Tax=Paramicrobacterium fandaimingii TaxID=2708079 RepID=UPI00141ED9DF|nr:TetR/AcrR family transcriptional regulator [Microbacterium fandaimingii]